MAPRGSAKTRTATKSDARAYLAKASEFLRAVQDSLALGNHTAATGNAIHAGIAAADAVAAAHLGTVWAGDHAAAARHVEAAPTSGKQAASQLRRLIPLKNRAEYDPMPMGASDARAAVKAAERLTEIARRAVERPG